MAKNENERVPDVIKQARGTLRKDRRMNTVPRSIGERKPRRPSRLTGYAAEFWYKNIDFLWENGWISRICLASFVVLCGIYADLRKLEDQVEERGMFDWQYATNGKRWSETPEFVWLNRLRGDFLRYAEKFGLTPTSARKFAKLEKPGADPEKPKLSLLEFSKGFEKAKGGA